MVPWYRGLAVMSQYTCTTLSTLSQKRTYVPLVPYWYTCTKMVRYLPHHWYTCTYHGTRVPLVLEYVPWFGSYVSIYVYVRTMLVHYGNTSLIISLGSTYTCTYVPWYQLVVCIAASTIMVPMVPPLLVGLFFSASKHVRPQGTPRHRSTTTCTAQGAHERRKDLT